MIQDFYAAIIANVQVNAATFAKANTIVETQFPADVPTEILNDIEWIMAMG